MNDATIETVLKILISAAAVITGWYAALKPLFSSYMTRRKLKNEAIEKTLKDDKEYRALVLEKLDKLDKHVDTTDEVLALLQRDNIERAYCMFVIEHGYCPSGMKQAISDTYESYRSRGYNHISNERVTAILKLPEFPEN